MQDFHLEFLGFGGQWIAADGPAGDHRNRDVSQPHVLPDQLPGPGVLAQQMPGLVIREDRARPAAGLPHPLPEGIVGVARAGAALARAHQPPGAVVAEARRAICYGIAGGLVAVAVTAVAGRYLVVEPLGSSFPHSSLPLELLLQSFARLPAWPPWPIHITP